MEEERMEGACLKHTFHSSLPTPAYPLFYYMIVWVDSDSTSSTSAVPPDPASFLLQPKCLASDGVYTSALMRMNDTSCQVEYWEHHKQRLLQSLSILHGAKSPDLTLLSSSIDQLVMQAVETYKNQAKPGGSEAIPQAHGSHTAMLVVSISPWQNENITPLFNIQAFIKTYSRPPPDTPIKAVVMGKPRPMDRAGSKYIRWLEDRKEIEERKQGADECLLCDKKGGLMEGLVTNFAVVLDRQDGRGPLLVTADPSTSPLLPGIMMSRVVEACHFLGLAVEHRPPLASERGLWVEAMVTNCLRGLQPVSSVTCPLGNLCGQEAWSVRLGQYGPGSCTTRLNEALQSSSLTFLLDDPLCIL